VRRVIELNSRMAGISLAQLALVVVLCVVAVLSGRLAQWSPVLVFLAGFGWLTGLGLAKLYKIIAFVTWLECYGPVLGKTPTPRVQDLVTEARAVRWFWLYFGAVDVAALALALQLPMLFRIAAACMCVATGVIVSELSRTRRLLDVTEALRLPAGTRQPRLLWALVADRR
jgi:dipeptide/tripeptide permease